MSVLVVSLLLWGLSLGPATKAATYIDTRPSLWAEVESLLEPWANVTLTCQAHQGSLEFQLFKDGVAQEPEHLLGMEHKFLLGAVTSETRGLYRCRTGMGGRWTELSNLVELSGADSLAPPLLSAEPVSWITRGLDTTLVCRGGLQGVTFLLKREGDDEFLEVAEAPKDTKATFLVHRAGNYSCSYRTYAAGNLSEPSATMRIEELEAPPPPALSLQRETTAVLRPGTRASFLCVAPLSGVEFQLRRGEASLLVKMSSTSPDRVFFDMDTVAPSESGLYTCRYRLREGHAAWSMDSAPAELLLSDGTLPAPVLEPEASPSPAPGELVRLLCHAPLAGMRFALEREDAHGRRVRGRLSPAGAVAHFELRDVSVQDSGNYSCVYVDPEPPFAGSVHSAPVELRVDGPPPKPQLRPLWRGVVTPGRDAVLHCESPLSDVTVELLREGEVVTSTVHWDTGPGVDLVLTYVGPQHAGNYSCRYRSWWPNPLLSDLSDPVELQVAAASIPTGAPGGNAEATCVLWSCQHGSSCHVDHIPSPKPASGMRATDKGRHISYNKMGGGDAQSIMEKRCSSSVTRDRVSGGQKVMEMDTASQ
ncbi:alpha-1B-glycoprotein [Trichechus manatus latirostris]|uniref:Alpha-1B-glycoprotein n=1 Tax=Trichechus manatus latirostris TaxID=127582 RepID=A0A2Y9E4W7_TRIMA|nr:alpha-1B-glycoprotein [Trichechus manatus latirostris]